MQLHVVNGWVLLTHPLMDSQLAELENHVSALKRKNPDTWQSKNAAKRLGALTRLMFEVIPADPGGAQFLLGNTMGQENRHWRRAKFFQQFRLFFRYDSATKVIIYAWVNDDSTLRAYESKTDAYRTFHGMLADGNPPTSWAELLSASS